LFGRDIGPWLLQCDCECVEGRGQGCDDTFDESAFVADLRAIDLTELIDADRQAFTAAIKEVESALFASSGRWTTEPVATVAARLCTQEMPVISAVP